MTTLLKRGRIYSIRVREGCRVDRLGKFFIGVKGGMGRRLAARRVREQESATVL